MILSQYISVCKVCSVNLVRFSTNCIFHKAKNYASREGRFMNKFLGGSKSHKKKFYPDVPLPSPAGFFSFIDNQSGISKKKNRRLIVLNKLFMESITDLMATGEFCQELYGKGLHISKVFVSPCLDKVNVHWLANGDVERDDLVENLLVDLAPKLRREMFQMRLMGQIPKIEFIKDAKYLNYTIVENILKKADFGEDFEPTPLANDWKSEKVLEKRLPDSVKGKIKEAESKEPVPDEQLPPMEMSVLGLNYSSIMEKVKQSVEKKKAAHRINPDAKLSLNESDNKDNVGTVLSNLNSTERKTLFKEYLRERYIAWKKAHKKEKKCRPEYEIQQKEMESMLMNEYLEDVYSDSDKYFESDSNYTEDEYYDEFSREDVDLENQKSN